MIVGRGSEHQTSIPRILLLDQQIAREVLKALHKNPSLNTCTFPYELFDIDFQGPECKAGRVVSMKDEVSRQTVSKSTSCPYSRDVMWPTGIQSAE